MVRVTIDTSEIQRVISNLGNAPKWVPQTVHTEMITLGKKVNAIMRSELGQHNYTSKLADSVTDEYNRETMTAEIGPTAKRGQYDAGLIAQFGTAPTRVPWIPIKRWGEARGLSPRQISGAWLSIATKGVKARPFLNETLQRGDFQAALEETANKIGMRLAAQVFVPSGVIGVATTE